MIEQTIQTLVDVVSVGGLYALTALGIGLIFGVMRLINFAHAQLIMAAGYMVLLFFAQSAAVAIAGAVAAAVLLALVVERAAFRPLRGADPATLLIAWTSCLLSPSKSRSLASASSFCRSLRSRSALYFSSARPGF